MNIPSYHAHEEFKNRTMKLSEIKHLGIDPYPATFKPSHQAVQLHTEYEGLDVGASELAQEGSTPGVSVAGRLMLFRSMGKNAFAQIQDGSGRLQLMFSRDDTHVVGLGEQADITAMKFIEKKLDLGDFIGVKGHLFRTQKGELTVFVKELTVLCKSLLPLPDKHKGLLDIETRYRKRWLDLISDQEVMNTFKTRSQILHLIRHYFHTHQFAEVETPVLQNLYGGAEASPFTTQLNALHQEMFLRISLEISLKKLIIGGMERVFEMSKVFRNEGLDRTHNPEFTMVEAYAAYWDYTDVMVFVENLFEHLAVELFGTPEIVFQDHTIHLKAPWIRMSMVEAIKRYANIDVHQKTDDELRSHLLEAGLKFEDIKKAPRGILIAKLFGELAEPHLIQPHHIIDHPIETTPLCKLHRDPELRKEGFVERFESFIMGSEICNAYSELNDPELQRQLLVHQNSLREQGNVEAHPLDEEFIEAICQGMPPTGGLGIGIDRLVMLFTKAASIRDVLFFPIMRPEASSQQEGQLKEENN
ncbi:MAG: lysine--tRNA ligase [Candidatus Rhabdochlamydia sp.]